MSRVHFVERGEAVICERHRTASLMVALSATGKVAK